MLDPDVDALVRAAMREGGLTFKQALNDTIRRGASPSSSTPFQTRTFDMGEPLIPLSKALVLAADLAHPDAASMRSISTRARASAVRYSSAASPVISSDRDGWMQRRADEPYAGTSGSRRFGCG